MRITSERVCILIVFVPPVSLMLWHQLTSFEMACRIVEYIWMKCSNCFLCIDDCCSIDICCVRRSSYRDVVTFVLFFQLGSIVFLVIVRDTSRAVLICIMFSSSRLRGKQTEGYIRSFSHLLIGVWGALSLEDISLFSFKSVFVSLQFCWCCPVVVVVLAECQWYSFLLWWSVLVGYIEEIVSCQWAVEVLRNDSNQKCGRGVWCLFLSI